MVKKNMQQGLTQCRYGVLGLFSLKNLYHEIIVMRVGWLRV
jgi:hypothetical protein